MSSLQVPDFSKMKCLVFTCQARMELHLLISDSQYLQISEKALKSATFQWTAIFIGSLIMELLFNLAKSNIAFQSYQ